MLGDIVAEPVRSWPLAALLLVLYSAAWFCLRAAWENGQRFSVPSQSQVTSSFDFGDDQSTMFSTEGRLYAIRDAGFAEAFAALNQARSDSLLGPREKARANRNFIAGLVILALIAIWAFFSK